MADTIFRSVNMSPYLIGVCPRFSPVIHAAAGPGFAHARSTSPASPHDNAGAGACPKGRALRCAAALDPDACSLYVPASMAALRRPAPQLENRIKTRRPAGEPIPHPGPPRRPRRASGKDGGVPWTTPAAPQRFRLPANAKTTTKVSSSVRENGPEQRKTAKRIRGKCHLPPTPATGMEGSETDRKTGRRSSLLRFPQNSGDGCRIPLTAMQVAGKRA